MPDDPFGEPRALDVELIDRLAQRVHENYRTTFDAADGLPWARLDEHLRDANRAQARAMIGKLTSVGARVEAGPRSDFAFSTDEIERLSRAEHRRWMAHKRHAGWIYAAVRDDRRRRHPMLIKWEKLSEFEREKDRDAVRRIPEVLASVGLRVMRQ